MRTEISAMKIMGGILNLITILCLSAMTDKLGISALPQRSNGREVYLKLDTDAP